MNQSPLQVQQWVERGLSLLQADHSADALQCFQRAGGLDSTDGRISLGLGLCHFKLGDFAAAAAALAQAQARLPGVPTAAIFEARALIELGRHEAARAVLSRIALPANLPPDEANEYAIACMGLQDYGLAQEVLQAALLRAPKDPYVLSNLAQLCERGNRLDQAQTLLDGVGQPDSFAQLLQARLHGRGGNAQAAVAELDRLGSGLHPGAPSVLAAQIDFERGRWLDQLGRYAEAFAAYAEGNRKDRDSFLRHNPGRLASGIFPWLNDRPDLDAAAASGAEAPEAEASPIFLVGFPRSGTTLLDQMLDAHPGLQVIEEKPLFDPIVAAIGRGSAGYPGGIASLGHAERREFRELYWREAARYGRRDAQIRLVDKQPLNTLRVHLIASLFPRAKWIFALRHPCDVVLSCFMQRFQFTEVTQGYWDLAETARLYRRTMALWAAQRSRLALDCIDLRYEDLVSRPQQEASRLLSFLRLDWNDSVLQPQEHARGRWITTPSYGQVSQPIHRGAIGRWLKYRQWMREAQAILAPTIRALGYDEPDAPQIFQ